MTTARLRVRWEPDAERELLRQPEVGRFVTQVGNEIADEIRAHAPYATGKLRDGIQDAEAELTRDGWQAFVAFLTFYTLAVEFGPNGRPFIRPGADSALRRHGSRLEGDRS